jgi:hypothetical protein
MKDLKNLQAGQLLDLVTENMATQTRLLKEDPRKLLELAICKREIIKLQQEIFIRYNA